MGSGFLTRMRCRPLKKAPSHGFTLIEAAVAIAIVAILAGAIAPLAVKAINQQREFRTRESLKACFEGMFGARDRRVANMRADFGFDPSAPLTNLSPMVLSSGIASYTSTSNGLFWGWNGPYWNGNSDSSNRPMDGWGRPIQLRWVTTVTPNGWQVFSLGANGIDDTGAVASPAGDDLGFPVVPAGRLSYTAVLYLNLNNAAGRTGTITVQSRNGGSLTNLVSSAYSAATIQSTSNPISGGINVNITRSGTTTLNYVFDLLPGEVRELQVTL